MKMMRVQLK